LPTAWQKFMGFLGLGEYDEREYVDDPHGPPDDDMSFDSSSSVIPPEPPQPPPRIKTLAADEEPSKDAVMREPRRADRLHVVAPENYNDAKEIGDQLRNDVPVIINLVEVDKDLRRRLVDFASGLAYGVRGKMERVADNVFLITPSNVEVSAEERRRMRERGLFSSGV